MTCDWCHEPGGEPQPCDIWHCGPCIATCRRCQEEMEGDGEA